MLIYDILIRVQYDIPPGMSARCSRDANADTAIKIDKDEDEEDDYELQYHVGIERLVNSGAYDDAYALHQVVYLFIVFVQL